MTDPGNFDAAPFDPTHGSSGPGGPLPPGSGSESDDSHPAKQTHVDPHGGMAPESNDSETRRRAADIEQPEVRSSAAEIVHPKWCDPKFCTVTADRDRWHASRPITVRGTGDTSDLTITVQLFAWPDGRNAYANIAPTLVDMEGQRHTEEWPVPGELALELGHVLVSLARQVTP